MRCIVLASGLLAATGCGRLDFGLHTDSGMFEAAPVDATLGDPCGAQNLIACYRFDGDTLDGTGNGHDATNIDIVFDVGHTNQAAYLSPTSDIAIAPSSDFATAEWTIEAWVWFDAYAPAGGYATIIDHDTNYAIELEPTRNFSCYTRGGPVAAIKGSSIVQLGAWVHVACAHRASATQLFINGALEVEGTNGPHTESAAALALGGEAPAPANQIMGRIDDVRIFREMRTATQICADANRSDCF